MMTWQYFTSDWIDLVIDGEAVAFVLIDPELSGGWLDECWAACIALPRGGSMVIKYFTNVEDAQVYLEEAFDES
jgi:hypothetical protein